MINCERLIAEVFKREPLWNSYNVLHRSAVATNNLWSEVADILGVDSHSVKKKWKGLRDYYRTELKKMYGHKPGDTTINLDICSHQVSTWPYYDMLYFLKDSMLSYYIKPKNKEAVYPEEEFCQMELTEEPSSNSPINYADEPDPVVKLLTPREQQIKTDPQDRSRSGSPDQSPDHNSGSQTEVSLLPLNSNSNGLHTLAEIANVADPAFPKKTKRPRFERATTTPIGHTFNAHAHMLEMERQRLAIYEKEAVLEEDDDFLFLRSLLPDIKTLPRSRKLLIRMKMQEMVYNEISKLENEVNASKLWRV